MAANLKKNDIIVICQLNVYPKVELTKANEEVELKQENVVLSECCISVKRRDRDEIQTSDITGTAKN